MTQKAHDIYQLTLDIVSRALMAGDLDTCLRFLAIPHQLRTLDAERLVTTEDEMRIALTDYRAFILGNGATSYIRLCDEAQFDTPNTIVGTHQSHLIAGGHVVLDPYMVEMTLIRQGPLWRATHSLTLSHNHDTPVISPTLLAKALHDASPDADKGHSK